MPRTLNWVANVMTLVVPPASAEVLPVTKVSSSVPPSSRNCSIWQCVSTPPGITSIPSASSVRAPFSPSPIAWIRPSAIPISERNISTGVTTVPRPITRS